MAKKLTDDEIRAITDQEIRQSMGFMGGKLSEARRKNEYYYLGQAQGDLSPPQVEGRSSVVSTDVADTVNWMLPNLLKIFTAGDNAVEFTPQKPEDEQAAKQATDYINYIFYKQNPGFNLLHTWFKDSLIQKNGILKVFWDVTDEETREEYRGMTEAEMTMLFEEEGIEPLEKSEYPDEQAAQQMHEAYAHNMMQYQQAIAQGQQVPPPPEPPPPPLLYDLAVKRTQEKGRVRIEAVPPEEFLISRRAKSIAEAPFVGHRVERTISYLRDAGYKNVDDITSDDTGADSSGEAITRRSYDDEHAFALDDDSMDESQRTVWLTECYMRLDADGDGIAEWRKIVRAGNALLENEECDGPPFVSITPIPLPHRFFGQCPADQAIESQRVNTSLTRAIMDNLYMGVNGRYFAVENQVNLDDLLTSRPGGIVRVKSPTAVGRLDSGMPGNAEAYKMLEHMTMVNENRTGFTRYSQGTDANSLNKTATGINIITNRSDARVELIARVYAETGVKDLFLLILKLVSQNQDKAAVMRLNNEWIDVDPSAWKTQFDFTVNVGLGTGNKDQQVQHLMALRQAQMEGLQFGVSTPQNLYHANAKLAENMGFKNVDALFTDPSKPPKEPPKPPPPDPKMLELQDKQHEGVARLQLEAKKHEDQIALERDKLEASITLQREEMTLKYQMAQESQLHASLQQQSEAEVQDAAEEMPTEPPVDPKAEMLAMIQQLHAEHAAKGVTKEVIRDASDRAVGVVINGVPHQLVRDEKGRAKGIQPIQIEQPMEQQ